VFFRLYLDALDEELVTLLASVSGHKAAVAPGVEEHEVAQSGLTEVGKRGFSVRQFVFISLCAEPGNEMLTGYMILSRPSRSSRP
jgi:hypothetical protein